jgi:translation initiation factor IF-3
LNTPFRPGGFRGQRPFKTQTPDTHRVNYKIIAPKVFVISETGEQLGVMASKDGIALAESRELDLVEVSPNSNPPVCKIMDYGKFKYKEQKKTAEARKHRTENVVKELRIRYRTDVGDLDVKLRQAREFLEEGDKVKFSMRFKGREAQHVALGGEKFKMIAEKLADVASIDEKSPIYGNQIYIVFAPLKGGKKS